MSSEISWLVSDVRDMSLIVKTNKRTNIKNEQQTQTLNLVFSRTELDVLPQSSEHEAVR